MPASPLDTIRTATLLGAVVPPLERQAGELRERIATLAKLREEGRRERTALANQLVGLRRERTELASLAKRTPVLRDRATAETPDPAARVQPRGRKGHHLRDPVKHPDTARARKS